MPTGAGIYDTHIDPPYYANRSPPNNSIILMTRYNSPRLSFYCCSNYTSAGRDGIFLGLNNIAYSGRISIRRESSSSNYAGCMYLHYPGYWYNLLENSEQGIYTCRMPDAAGEYIDVSFGIYRQDYSGK